MPTTETRQIQPEIFGFRMETSYINVESKQTCSLPARMFDELLWRDHKDGCATGQPQGVGSEAYLNGTSQGSTPEDARKDSHIRGRSRQFVKHPG